MVLLHFLIDGAPWKAAAPVEQVVHEHAVVEVEQVLNGANLQSVKSARVREPHIYPLFAEYYPYDEAAEDEFKIEMPNLDKHLGKPEKPAVKYALRNPGSSKARIAIVIDDVGMNRKQSRAVVDINDVPLTLAFLPYAPNLTALTEPAQAAGHELIIHMPMEPMDGSIDTGSIALKSAMSNGQLKEMLEQAFNSFDGYVGINNHMGSRLTQDKQAMDLVMDVLDARGLFYLDSKTISTSVAAKAAKDQGLAYAERDVFLDHEDSLSFARGALKRAEKVALEKGYAIVIGHPKANSVAALKEWIPTIEARGFEVVPVSDLLMRPTKGDVTIAKAEAKPKSAKKRSFIKKEPILQDVEPAAGDAKKVVPALAAEDLLNAPIGGLYSLSE